MATPIPNNTARLSSAQIMEATGGCIVHQYAGCVADGVGVATDCRAVVPGNVFVALRGARHDGHHFAAEAVHAGAAMLVLERGRTNAVLAHVSEAERARVLVIEVDDSLSALGAMAGVHLAQWRRARATRRVVAITGSAGKTTTKEMTAALLGAIQPTHSTRGNLNNRVGVPMVIFGVQDTHEFLVLEMGMSLPGELEAITSFARPDVSIVTNIGLAHAEGVGGIEGVQNEKGALYRCLGDGGVAVVNDDDPRVVDAAAVASVQRRVGFGLSPRADYQLRSREPQTPAYLGARVSLRTPHRSLDVDVPFAGAAAAVDVASALAAQEVAAGGCVLQPSEIERALQAIRLEGRTTMRCLGGGIVVIDDTYNANPASMAAALQTLCEVGRGRRRVAVLGEMKELGAESDGEHVALGDRVADAEVTLAIGCGGRVSLALQRARERGVRVIDAASTDEAVAHAVTEVRASDAVLVKASRSVGAERVVAALLEAWPFVSNRAGSES